ncbi:MAG: hypothetical protein B7Z37_24830 [Verrucomicrobia bacterium 12-59-8]|nr:MAG: hypothetical protein B7Z37_24830 [Verrucomicrobia bacterium 12-59-8]
MKASRCPFASVARTFAMLTPVVLLVQCSMPPQQAWRSIQTHGLLPYLSSSRQYQSPPLRAGSSNAQRYAAHPQSRSTPTANWFSNWNSGMPNRINYGATNSTGYPQNSYFSTRSSNSGSSRNAPRSSSGSPSGARSPDVKIPVEEPTHTPHIVHNPPPDSSTPKTNGSTDAAAADLPYGTAVPGRINMVNSPFAGKTQLVDVSGMSAGQMVKCPYTGKLFKVPPTQQAANQVEPRLEAKIETPKLSEEPQAGDKKP